jgi:hypothetical protein
MESLDNELETRNKFKKLEEDLVRMQELLVYQQEAIKDTQRYLIKVAHGQQELSKRLLAWPYIKVPTKKTKDV